MNAAELNAAALMRAQITHLTQQVQSLRCPLPPAERDAIARAQSRADGAWTRRRWRRSRI